MPIGYDVTRLADGKYKLFRLNASGRKSPSPISFTRPDLEVYLKDSVSKARLEQALRTLDAAGHMKVEADLET